MIHTGAKIQKFCYLEFYKSVFLRSTSLPRFPENSALWVSLFFPLPYFTSFISSFFEMQMVMISDFFCFFKSDDAGE